MYSIGRDQIYKLANGRKLGYAISGKPSGKTIVFFHGWPGTRLDISCFDNIAQKNGVRLISIDRPGCGLSSYQKKRKVEHLKYDVIELLDYLGISKISALGFSTGALYVLDLVKMFPERIESVGIVSGVPYYTLKYNKKKLPFSLKVIKILARLSGINRCIIRTVSDIGLNRYKRNPEREFNKSLLKLSKIDKETWNNPTIRNWFINEYLPDLLESNRKGLAQDLLLLIQSFAKPVIPPEKLETNFPVYFWHGKIDEVVPSIASIQQSKLFTNSELILYPNEGHKIVYTHFEEIIRKL